MKAKLKHDWKQQKARLQGLKSKTETEIAQKHTLKKMSKESINDEKSSNQNVAKAS